MPTCQEYIEFIELTEIDWLKSIDCLEGFGLPELGEVGLPHSDQLQGRRAIEEGSGRGRGWSRPLHMPPLEQL